MVASTIMRRRRAATLFIAGLGVAGALTSCRGATKITLDMRTDVPCAATRGTSVTAGAAGHVEHAAPASIAAQCDSGRIGTLVITPASTKTETIAIRVVLGVNADAASCTTENGYKGCIVARREVTFIAHEDLEIPIDLLNVCVDVPCDEHTTCAKNGLCVPAASPDDSAVAPPARDAQSDADEGDAGRDAASDAPSDGATEAGGDAGDGVACPDGTNLCGNTNLCCWNRFTDTGACQDGGATCSGTKMTCTPTSCGSGVCCYSASGPMGPATHCTLGSCLSQSQEAQLCSTNADCPASTPNCAKSSTMISPPNGRYGTCGM